ncbi:SusC/RagA family TonB-linked outer membrane protein [Flavilitoribacter nigricans]|uniref:SusC/RagA family TonB-linked outer membrane protein n=1 Tax=Flavilitoribacter nigricans (strain ATCC 23147 / DSM 23189 / NBRC 102662 / NCIMB 1420 / SS-2) TaxID=1122177 RepID=A0A2D0N7W4_FLAN2|nr:TonB-dependent receptor [Flavilitoribacter nigricans]PHN04488.1 SusC/RagA family TonB-linked outer membrane protein [Flavilitoribacter nigricans DSM 23189 = NBRC 102662]
MKRKPNSQLKFLLLFSLFCWGMLFSPPVRGDAKTADLYAEELAHTVNGTVLSDEGDPLIGVTVLVKGTSVGTVTDFDGNYSIDLDDGNGTLVFSYTGYTSQEVAVNGRTTIDITMEVDIASLEEVVVVGYGSQKKVNLTGAVSSVTSEALENRPIPSVGQGLQGLIPNLNVSIRNGDPTRSADFNIRGFESINGGSPLILVDGVPMALERINPNDIASVNVLKDASAAAVYGARAAFGVILVETKKGKSGKVNIQLSSELSAAKPIFNMDPVTDPYQFVLARNRANIRTNGAPSYADDYVAGVKAFSEGTGPEWAVVDGVLQYYGYNDYQNRLMTDYAPQQRHDLSISGATDKSSFYVSFGALNKDGYLRHENNENFKRYNVLMKADFQVNDWLSLDEKIVFNAQKSDKPHFYNWDVNINTVARVSPILPIEFPDLEYYLTPGDRGDYEQYIGMHFASLNFFPYLEQGGRQTFTNNDLWLTQGVTLTPLKGLRIRGEFSYNSYHRDYQDVASKIDVIENRDLIAGINIGNGFSGNDWIDNRSNYNQYNVLNTYAEYTFDQATDHYFRAMVGFNQEWGRNTFIRSQANTLITPLVTDLNATTGNQQTFGSKSHVALRGAFYRLNYIFKDKYLIEANGRYDGTSRFPKDDRFGFFPSVSVGWRISEEPFLESARGWLDNLKVRASYGTLGNQLLGSNYYPYVSTMGIGTSPYMMSAGSRTPYVSAAGLVSPTLTWESVTSRNIGLDFTILNSRLDASFDIYTRETKDMLTDVEYPSILGTAAPQANAADLRTDGWEASLTWRDKIGSDLNYRVTLALSDWQSEITKYDNPTGALSEYYVGQKIGEIWGYETVGIFQTEAEVAESADQSRIGSNWRPGDIRYADLNGDGEISPGNNTLGDPGDRKIIGNATPRYSFGVNLDLNYKAFSLTTFFQGIGKRDYWPASGNWVPFFPFNAGHVENYFITDTWTEDNRDAYFPAAHISTNTKQNLQTQSRYLQQASYIRLKNLTLSYRLPTAALQSIGLGSAQIYVAGMNLWEASGMRKPLDPEQIHTNVLSGQNFNGAQEYPLQRIYSFGINVGF